MTAIYRYWVITNHVAVTVQCSDPREATEGS